MRRRTNPSRRAHVSGPATKAAAINVSQTALNRWLVRYLADQALTIAGPALPLGKDKPITRGGS